MRACRYCFARYNKRRLVFVAWLFPTGWILRPLDRSRLLSLDNLSARHRNHRFLQNLAPTKRLSGVRPSLGAGKLAHTSRRGTLRRRRALYFVLYTLAQQILGYDSLMMTELLRIIYKARAIDRSLKKRCFKKGFLAHFLTHSKIQPLKSPKIRSCQAVNT